jgi:hypothetical protein
MGTCADVREGAIRVEDGASFSVGGAMVNQGAIELVSYGDATRLIVSVDATLSGDGAVTLSDHAGSQIMADKGATVPLTNHDTRISGAAMIGGGLRSVRRRGRRSPGSTTKGRGNQLRNAHRRYRRRQP